MAKLIKIHWELTGIAAIPASVRRDVFRTAIGEAGGHWWQKFLPIHFTNAAYGRYQYTKRQSGYERAKRQRRTNGQGRKAIGEVKPLVWTGESRERATKAKQVVSKATSSTKFYCLVILNARALNFRNPKSKVDMRAEVLRLIPSETAELEHVFQQAAIQGFKQRGHYRTVKKIAG